MRRLFFGAKRKIVKGKAGGSMKKIRILFLCTYLLVAAATFAGEFLYQNRPMVRISPVRLASVTDTISCNGTLRSENVGVFPENPVRVLRVFVREGQYVEKGDLLAQVDLNDIGARIAGNLEDFSLPESASLDAGSLYSENALENMLQNLRSLTDADYQRVTANSCAIRAPESGYVAAVHAEEGKYAGLVSPLFLICNLEKMSLVLRVSENDISSIQIGQIATVTGASFPGTTYYATVSSIANQATQSILGDSSSRVQVVLQFENTDISLFPGTSATAKIRVGKRNGVMQVPAEAISQDETGSEYLFAYEDGKAVKRAVTCHYSVSGFAEVEDLSERTLIIVSSDKPLSENVSVRLCED